MMRCAQCDAAISPALSCPECGQPPLLEGRYRLEAVIGQGASGTVYRAEDTATGATLAVKALPFHHTLDAATKALFEREGAILSQLSHPAIPAWHGQLIAGRGRARSLYLLQEFIEGISLKDELERKRYTESGALSVMDELLAILTYLHALSPPVIHRDLKPANIMRRPDGSLALIDFGSVRDVLQRTLSGGTVAGTFGFMAPEQFAGEATAATDIYGVAATVVALLSRKDPATLHTRDGQFQWRGRFAVQPQVEALLASMLEPDPRQRASDAAALRAEIARIRSGAPPPRKPPALSPSGATGGDESLILRKLLGPRGKSRAPLFLGLFGVAMTFILGALSVLWKVLVSLVFG